MSPMACPSCEAALAVEEGCHEVVCPLCGRSIILQAERASEAVTLPPIPNSTIGSHQPQIPDIPGYEILDVLGRGGMGIVYKARQTGLNRLVAVKMVVAGGYATDTELARFRTEAEAVARLHHPGIVQVYEIGVHANLPYFSLEYCPGGSLAQQLNGTPQPSAQAAFFVATLADAVQAAHEAGIVHRDLKPANILLAVSNQPPAISRERRSTSEGRNTDRGWLTAAPKIADFGLAKRLDEAGPTRTGAVMGTPSYMAPEQAGGEVKKIGPATDVYALGAILYELLTGRPPFKAASDLDTVLQVLSEDVVPPSRLAANLAKDLETICLKCLHKEPARRYASAAALAGDLRCFLAGKPIAARRVSGPERAWRWCRRNPWVASLSAAFVLALLIGSGISTYFAVLAQQRADRLDKETERANEKAQEADLQSKQAKEKAEEAGRESKRAYDRAYVSDIRLLQRAGEQNHNQFASELLVRTRPENTGGKDYRGFEWYYLNRPEPLLTLKGHRNQVTAMAYSSDGKRLASAAQADSVKVWNTATGREIFAAKTQGTSVQNFAFSPNGKRLAAAAHTALEIWDADTGQLLHTLKIEKANIGCVAFSSDGRRLASGGTTFDGDGEIRVWDAELGRGQFTIKETAGQVTSVAFSPDGKWIASGSIDRTVKVWDATKGQPIRTFRGIEGFTPTVAFSPDGTRLVSSGHDKVIKIWDVGGDRELLSIEVPEAPARAPHRVTFSPDGKWLIDVFGGIRVIWDASTGTPVSVAKVKVNGAEVNAYTPDGTRLVTSTDGVHSTGSVLSVWDANVLEEQPLPLITRTRDWDHSGFVAFSLDGKQMITGGEALKLVKMQGEKVAEIIGKDELKIWDAATRQEVRTLKCNKDSSLLAQYSANGKWLVCLRQDKTLNIWDVNLGREVRTLQDNTSRFGRAAFSPDGRRVAGSSFDRLQIWDVDSGQIHFTIKGRKGQGLAYSPDGQWLAGAIDDTMKIWNAETGQQVRILQGDCNSTGAVKFSPDGRQLAAGIGPTLLKIWDAHSGDELCTLRGHTAPVSSIVFSPDGERLVSGGVDGAVKLWETRHGQEVLSLKPGKPGDGVIYQVAFSPDGTQLAAASTGVMIWKIRK